MSTNSERGAFKPSTASWRSKHRHDARVDEEVIERLGGTPFPSTSGRVRDASTFSSRAAVRSRFPENLWENKFMKNRHKQRTQTSSNPDMPCMVLQAKNGPVGNQEPSYKARASLKEKQEQAANRKALRMIKKSANTTHFFTEGFPSPVNENQTSEDLEFSGRRHDVVQASTGHNPCVTSTCIHWSLQVQLCCLLSHMLFYAARCLLPATSCCYMLLLRLPPAMMSASG